MAGVGDGERRAGGLAARAVAVGPGLGPAACPGIPVFTAAVALSQAGRAGRLGLEAIPPASGVPAPETGQKSASRGRPHRRDPLLPAPPSSGAQAERGGGRRRQRGLGSVAEEGEAGRGMSG